MEPKALFAGLEQWHSFSLGWWLDLVEPSGPVRHAFCGAHEIPGARCFAGGHLVLRFLSLDTTDERLGLGGLGVPFVHLLYCWRCGGSDLEYRLERDGGVTVLGEPEWRELMKEIGRDPEEVRAELRNPDVDFPYRGYPIAFPLRDARLRAVDPEAQEAIAAAERTQQRPPAPLDAPRHQIGGLPYVVQGTDHVPECAGCEEQMAFVASVANDCGDPRGFTTNPYVQVLFFLCPACRRVKAFNVCD